MSFLFFLAGAVLAVFFFNGLTTWATFRLGDTRRRIYWASGLSAVALLVLCVTVGGGIGMAFAIYLPLQLVWFLIQLTSFNGRQHKQGEPPRRMVL